MERSLSLRHLAEIAKDREIIARQNPSAGKKAREEMFWYSRPAVTVTLSRSWGTRQVILGTTGTLVIETLRPINK